MKESGVFLPTTFKLVTLHFVKLEYLLWTVFFFSFNVNVFVCHPFPVKKVPYDNPVDLSVYVFLL